MIFNESGVSVSPEAENSWSWHIALSGFGYSGQASPITVKPQLSVDKNRVEYEYSPQLTEWYINDERGLEQGFTIEIPPQPRINTPLVIEMALDTTLTPRAIDSGEAIAFFDGSGEHIKNRGIYQKWYRKIITGLKKTEKTARQIKATKQKKQKIGVKCGINVNSRIDGFARSHAQGSFCQKMFS